MHSVSSTIDTRENGPLFCIVCLLCYEHFKYTLYKTPFNPNQRQIVVKTFSLSVRGTWSESLLYSILTDNGGEDQDEVSHVLSPVL